MPSSSPSASASASASGSQPPISPAASSPPPNAKRPRRTHARRSCLSCRQRKARCELPEHSLGVPSSMTPLDDAGKCHRCAILQLDCIVWDGERKRGEGGRMRYGVEATTIAASTSSSPVPSSSSRHQRAARSWDHDDEGRDGERDGRSPSPARRIPETTMLLPIIESWSSISSGRPTHDRSNSRHDGKGRTNGSISRPQAGLTASRDSRSLSTAASPHPGHDGSCHALDGTITQMASGASTTGRRLRATVVAPPSPRARSTLSYIPGSPMSQLAELLWRQDAYRDRIAMGTSKGRQGWKADPPRTLSTETPGFETFVLRLSLWCPFLDVEAATGGVEASQGVVFLRHVTAYLFLRGGASRPSALSTLPFIASEASRFLMTASSDRHVAQALLLLALYEPIDLTLPPPDVGQLRRLGRTPGAALFSAAKHIADSLKPLDRLKMFSRRGQDETRTAAGEETDEGTQLEILQEACRDAALWLSNVLVEINGVSLPRGEDRAASVPPSFLEEEEEALELLALVRERVPKTQTHLHASISLLLTRAKLYRRVYGYLSEAETVRSDPSSLPTADKMTGHFTSEMEALTLEGEHELARLPPSADLTIFIRCLQVESLVCQVRPIIVVTYRCLLGETDMEKLDVAKVPRLVDGVGVIAMRHLASLARTGGELAQKALCILGFVRSESHLEVLRCAPTVPLCSLAVTLSKVLAERMAANLYGWKRVPPEYEAVMSALHVGRDALLAAGRGQRDSLFAMTGKIIGAMAASVEAKVADVTREAALARARGVELGRPHPNVAEDVESARRVYAGEEDAEGRRLNRPPSAAGQPRQGKRLRLGSQTGQPVSDFTIILQPDERRRAAGDAAHQPSSTGAREISSHNGDGDGFAIHPAFERSQPSAPSFGAGAPLPTTQTGPRPPGSLVAGAPPNQRGESFPMQGAMQPLGDDDAQLLAEWSSLGIDLELWSGMLQALNPAENGGNSG